MLFVLLVILLTVLSMVFLLDQKTMERRLALQEDLPRERLVPRHYKSFTEVEKQLWQAVQGQQRSEPWENVRFERGEPQFAMALAYVHRLREDFQKGHRIFGQIILHSPEMTLCAQLEWERIKIEWAYYRWCFSIWFHLKTIGISMKELRQLTEVVATLSYRVRTLLHAFEDSGNTEFVDSLLRRS